MKYYMRHKLLHESRNGIVMAAGGFKTYGMQPEKNSQPDVNNSSNFIPNRIQAMKDRTNE